MQVHCNKICLYRSHGKPRSARIFAWLGMFAWLSMNGGLCCANEFGIAAAVPVPHDRVSRRHAFHLIRITIALACAVGPMLEASPLAHHM
jgi:hypothetical protein